MTRHDRQILFTSLAFLAVAMKGGNAAPGSAQVKELAALLDDYCAASVPAPRRRRRA